MSNSLIARKIASARPSAVALAAAAPRHAWHLTIDGRTVLAASGFVMLGFIAAHLGGNLLAFAGSSTFNAYARSLRELGSPALGEGVLLTLARVTVGGALIAHLAAHLRIMQQRTTGLSPTAGGTPRPGTNPHPAPCVPTPPPYAAFPLPVFRATGGVMVLFLIFHLIQLTFGAANPAFNPSDPYGNTVAALRSWPVALAYIAAATAVGAHLLPGTWTGMRSLHLIRPRTERLARVLAPAVALTIALGMASVPTAVLLGVLR